MEELFTLTPAALGAIPLVVGIVEVLKLTGLDSGFAPVASILLGVAILAIAGFSWPAFLLSGVIVGLSASGLYAGGKKTGEAIKEAFNG